MSGNLGSAFTKKEQVAIREMITDFKSISDAAWRGEYRFWEAPVDIMGSSLCMLYTCHDSWHPPGYVPKPAEAGGAEGARSVGGRGGAQSKSWTRRTQDSLMKGVEHLMRTVD